MVQTLGLPLFSQICEDWLRCRPRLPGWPLVPSLQRAGVSGAAQHPRSGGEPQRGDFGVSLGLQCPFSRLGIPSGKLT